MGGVCVCVWSIPWSFFLNIYTDIQSGAICFPALTYLNTWSNFMPPISQRAVLFFFIIWRTVFSIRAKKGGDFGQKYATRIKRRPSLLSHCLRLSAEKLLKGQPLEQVYCWLSRTTSISSPVSFAPSKLVSFLSLRSPFRVLTLLSFQDRRISSYTILPSLLLVKSLKT